MDVLLNWLWQGGIVALAAAALLRVIPQSRTQARYGLAWAACVVVLALPAVPRILAAAASVPAADDAPAFAGPVVSMPIAWWTSTALALALWLVWCGLYAARVVAAALALRDTKGQCRECPPRVEARLHHWSRVRATGRRTRLVVSTRVRSAAVLGCGSPLIAVAPGLLAQLSDADLDRVVIHEWAHVQRRDDIAQFLQLLVRMVAGWHPAVWWLERQLELEREVACDEIAVAVTGSAKEYAECLATLAALPSAPVRWSPALAAVSSSGLRRRIVRILATHRVVAAQPWRAIASCASVALATLAIAVGNVHVVKSAAASSSRSGATPPAAVPAIATQTSTTFDPVAVGASSSSPVPTRRSRSSDARVRPAKRDDGPLPAVAAATQTMAAPPASTVAPVPSRFLEFIEAHSTAPAAESPLRADVKARTPWASTADAGAAIGLVSKNAGVAAAGLFSRFGRTIARSF